MLFEEVTKHQALRQVFVLLIKIAKCGILEVRGTIEHLQQCGSHEPRIIFGRQTFRLVATHEGKILAELIAKPTTLVGFFV
jgi:hypothetical protein